MIGIILLVVVVLLLVKYYRRDNRLQKMPGPKGVPVLGNVLQMDPKRADLSMVKWAEEYGEIYKLNIFGQNAVVVNSMEAIREVLVKKGAACAGRPRFYRAKIFSNGFHNLGFSNPSPTWKKLRNKVIRVLRMYDNGLQRLENITGDILNDLTTAIRKTGGEEFDPMNCLHSAILNIIYLLMIGEKFNEEDEEYNLLKEAEKLSIDILSADPEGAKLDQFPWLRFFGNQAAKNLAKYQTVSKRLTTVLKEKVISDLDAGMSKDAVLYPLYEAVLEGELDENQVDMTGMDLVLGGVSTTLANLYAAFNILAHHPQVLKKIRTEADAAVGDEAGVVLRHRQQMPYLRATIYEIIRYTTVGTLGFPHVTLEDTELCGYQVPKNTQLFTNMFHLHHNEKDWVEPYKFNPERFLDDEGCLLAADSPVRRHMMAFSAGPRGCVGEQMALSRMFLILGNITQKFDILPGSDSSADLYDPRNYNLALALQHKPYSLRMLPRKPVQAA